MTMIAVDLGGLTSVGLISSISRSQKALQKMLCVCLGHYDLTLSQWQVLGTLLDGRASPTDVAKACNMMTPQVSLVLMGIKRRRPGAIVEVTNEEDLRSKLLGLSDSGRSFVMEVEQKLQHCIEREIAKKVAPNDLETYIQVTQFIGNNVKHL